MKTYELIAQIVSKLGGGYNGSVTSATATTITDSNMKFPDGYLTGGFIVIRTGTLAGTCRVISSHAGSKLTFATTTTPVVAGSKYLAFPSTFTLNDIIEEINNVLTEECKYLSTDISLTVVADTQEYELPDGVDNVLRVEVATSDDEPYNFVRNYWWREIDGFITFDDGKEPTSENKIIKVWFMKVPDRVDEDDDIPRGVVGDFVSWSVVERLWRSYISDTRKDNSISIDMKNEAAAKADRALAAKSTIPTVTMSRDPHYSRW